MSFWPGVTPSSLGLSGCELSSCLHCDSYLELHQSSEPHPQLPSTSCSHWGLAPFPLHFTQPLSSDGGVRLNLGGEDSLLYGFQIPPRSDPLQLAPSPLLLEIRTMETHSKRKNRRRGMWAAPATGQWKPLACTELTYVLLSELRLTRDMPTSWTGLRKSPFYKWKLQTGSL